MAAERDGIPVVPVRTAALDRGAPADPPSGEAVDLAAEETLATATLLAWRKAVVDNGLIEGVPVGRE